MSCGTWEVSLQQRRRRQQRSRLKLSLGSLSRTWAGRVRPRRHWAVMISLPGQTATTGPAERGGARGASPQGTAPGTRPGARGSLSRVPRPRNQDSQGWAPGPAGRYPGQRPSPGTRPWEGDPRRWGPSPFRSGQPGVSGRKGLRRG